MRAIKKYVGEGGAEEKKLDAGTIELEKKYAGEVCDKCGTTMKVRVGKYGPFLACSAYPKCKNIKNIDNPEDAKAVACPICQKGKIVKKFSRRGPFYACSNYPDCKNAYSGAPTGEKCPDCGGLLIDIKDSGVKCSNRDCRYKK